MIAGHPALPASSWWADRQLQAAGDYYGAVAALGAVALEQLRLMVPPKPAYQPYRGYVPEEMVVRETATGRAQRFAIPKRMLRRRPRRCP